MWKRFVGSWSFVLCIMNSSGPWMTFWGLVLWMSCIFRNKLVETWDLLHIPMMLTDASTSVTSHFQSFNLWSNVFLMLWWSCHFGQLSWKRSNIFSLSCPVPGVQVPWLIQMAFVCFSILEWLWSLFTGWGSILVGSYSGHWVSCSGIDSHWCHIHQMYYAIRPFLWCMHHPYSNYEWFGFINWCMVLTTFSSPEGIWIFFQFNASATWLPKPHA